MAISSCSSCDTVNRLLSAANTGLIQHSAPLSKPGETQKPKAIPDGPVGKSELTANELQQVRDLEQSANLQFREANEGHEAPDADDAAGTRTTQQSQATRTALSAIYAQSAPQAQSYQAGQFINVAV